MNRRQALEATRGAADRVVAGVAVGVVILPPVYLQMDLSPEEIARLRFLKWRLGIDSK